MKKACPKIRGFTLIELLVVIAILAILAVIGFTVFSGISKNARDAKRKQDINAIFKAYETKYTNLGAYEALAPSDFAAGAVPVDPSPSKGAYFMVRGGTGFKVCASLESNSNSYCSDQSSDCYCLISAQGCIESADSLTHDDGRFSPSSGLGTCPSSSAAPTSVSTLIPFPTSTPFPTATPIPCGNSNGLVGYWKLDNNANDSSVNRNNGTFNGSGTHWAGGKISSAGQFNGTDDYVNVSDNASLDVTNGITISAWVKADTLSASQGGGILAKSPFTNAHGTYQLFSKGGGNQFTIGLNAGDIELWGTTVPTLGQWYLVTATYDKVNLKIYVNGVLENSVAYTTPITADANNIRIGQYYGSTTHLWNGSIDDARIYARALTGPEIAVLSNSGAGCSKP